MYERQPPPDRDAQVEELLADGLAEAGARGGRMGGGAAGASGGAAGARFAARLLRTTHHEEEHRLPVRRPGDALAVAQDVLAHLGTVVWSAPRRDGGHELRAMIGSGWLNMNPAVVDVHVRPGGRLTVRAAAKEGPIPQRTARKAVRRVIEALYSAAPPS